MRTPYKFVAPAIIALAIIVLFPSCAECGERKPEAVAHAVPSKLQELLSLLRACDDYAARHGIPQNDPAYPAVLKGCMRGLADPDGFYLTR